ncbi:MAG: cyclic nucleotide-binding domain-containing protein [Fibrobacter sp.]|nr:cyclic nucleotide-binding domain-containing protein [Fibrobacter sp.]
MVNSAKDQLKTGMRPQQQIRHYKAGEVIFEEGSTGRELIIIQEGNVGVYKDTPEGKVELATVEKGGIIGEMALLDNLPRSATVKALQNTSTLVINQLAFHTVMNSVPVWLQSIIKIIVSRLRDANKRVDQSALRDKAHGLVSLILLLLPVHSKDINSSPALSLNLLISEGFFISRLRKKEILKIIEQLQAKTLIRTVVSPQDQSDKMIIIDDPEVLRLYEEYLVLKVQKKTFKEASISDDAVALLSNIAYVAQKSGVESDEGTMLMKTALIEDLSDKNPEKLDKKLLDLRRKNLINILPSADDSSIIFRKELLIRIKKIREWLPKFEMEVQ